MDIWNLLKCCCFEFFSVFFFTLMLQQMGLHHLATSRTTTRAPNFRDRIIVGIGLEFDGGTWLVQVLFVDHPTARGGTMLWNFGTWEWPSSGSQARASPVDFHELMVRWCQMWEGHWGVWNQGASTRKSHGVCFTTSRGRSYLNELFLQKLSSWSVNPDKTMVDVFKDWKVWGGWTSNYS